MNITDGRAIPYSEREREFTFAKNEDNNNLPGNCVLCWHRQSAGLQGPAAVPVSSCVLSVSAGPQLRWSHRRRTWHYNCQRFAVEHAAMMTHAWHRLVHVPETGRHTSTSEPSDSAPAAEPNSVIN